MLLLIDNYDSFTYNLYQAVAVLGTEVRVIRNDKLTLSDIKKMPVSGIILSPGPGRPEDAGICVAVIHAMVQHNLPAIPLLGVCLGHQALTLALGGKVIQANEICHGKDDLVYHQQQSIYRNMPMPFKAGRYHSLIAERESLPSSLVIEAESENKLVMGIRHHELPLYGVQFHPESILTPEGHILLNNFVELCQLGAAK